MGRLLRTMSEKINDKITIKNLIKILTLISKAAALSNIKVSF